MMPNNQTANLPLLQNLKWTTFLCNEVLLALLSFYKTAQWHDNQMNIMDNNNKNNGLGYATPLQSSTNCEQDYHQAPT